MRTSARTIDAIKPSTWSNDDYLATSATLLPIFWLALFDTTSIVMRTIDDEMGKPFSYPVLLDDTHTAVERAAKRASAMFAVLAPSNRDLLRVFLNYVTLNAPKHLYVEDVELWSMDSPAAYQTLLTNCFAAFAPDAPAAAWDPVLRQAQLSNARNATPVQLAGASWTRDIPWKT